MVELGGTRRYLTGDSESCQHLDPSPSPLQQALPKQHDLLEVTLTVLRQMICPESQASSALLFFYSTAIEKPPNCLFLLVNHSLQLDRRHLEIFASQSQ